MFVCTNSRNYLYGYDYMFRANCGFIEVAVVYTIDSSNAELVVVVFSCLVLDSDCAEVWFCVALGDTSALEDCDIDKIPPELTSNEEDELVLWDSFDGGGAAVDAQVETVERNTSVSDCLR